MAGSKIRHPIDWFLTNLFYYLILFSKELNTQLSDVQQERANHQKLIKDHNKLEQRYEKATSELLKMLNVRQTTTTNTERDAQIESLLEDLVIRTYL